MAFKDLRQYIETLDKFGEVQKVDREVHWNLEAGAILRRTYEMGLPAPFFQKITGYPKGYRMFGGNLSKLRRIAIALEMDPESTYKQLVEEYIKRRTKKIKPSLVKNAPCKENIQIGDKVDLLKFPAPMIHEGDGGRYICSWHAHITKDPDTGWVNWGMYRAMLHTKNSIGGLLEPYKHIGYLYYRKFEANNKPMPVAVAIGMEPICSLVALTPESYGQNEVELAGALRREPVELVKCETVDLEVPATSEIVIEGEVYPHERVSEGPFGEFTGYRASPRDRRPVIRVKAVTYRNDPILTMSCMGVPVDDCHAPQAVTSGGELLVELKRKGIPVRDLAIYPECALFFTVVSVKPPFAGIAEKISHTIWSMEGMAAGPYILVVEDDVDVHNIWQVLHAFFTKCHPYRGIQRLEHTQGSSLWPFLTRHERLNRLGSKAYFDATWPLDWDPSIAVPPRASFDNIYSKETQEHVLKNWKNYGYKVGIPEKNR